MATDADIFEAMKQVEDPELGPLLMPAVAPRLSRTPGGVRWPGPRLGQHTDEVLAEAGLDDDARAQLRAAGVT